MDTLSLVSKYLKDLEECMDDGDSKVAKELKLFDALEHKSVVIEVDNQKITIFTKAPLEAFGEPFMRYSIPCKVNGQGAWDAELDLADSANYFKADFVVLDYVNEGEPSIMFRRDFLVTTKSQVDCEFRGYFEGNDEIGVLEFFSTLYFDKDLDRTNLMKEKCICYYVDDKIKKCSEPIYCEYWTSKMLADELDEENTCLKKETGIPTQAAEGSSGPRQEHGGGSYGLGDDDYFTSAMPDFGGSSSGYAVGGSSRKARFSDDDMDE
ncbi:hypothetical protein Tco_0814226 [Tanacetum coccineum]